MGNLNILDTLLQVRGRLVAEKHLVYTSGQITIFSFSLSCSYGSRLSKKASSHSLSLAVFAEQILGQLNFSCLVIFCFPDTLRIQLGICTIIAGSCWHLSRGTQHGLPDQSQLLTAAALLSGSDDDGKWDYFKKCSH